MTKPFTTTPIRRVSTMALVLGAALLATSCNRPEEDEQGMPAPAVLSQNSWNDAGQLDEPEVLEKLMTGLSGGKFGTMDNQTAEAFNQSMAQGANVAGHASGRTEFERTFDLAALDPIWVQDACTDCHVGGGRSKAPRVGSNNPQLLFRISTPGPQDPLSRENRPVEVLLPDGKVLDFGTQLQPIAIAADGVTRLIGTGPEGRATTTYTEEPQTLKDGEVASLRRPTYTFSKLPAGTEVSPRIGANVAGLGLLGAVTEYTIREMAAKQQKAALKDFDNAMPISGRVNTVPDYTLPRQASGAPAFRLGRYGWKAGQPSLRQQNAGALNGDMAVTTPLFPFEPGEATVRAAGPDLTSAQLSALTVFTTTLGVPKIRNTTPGSLILKEGLTLFAKANCSACHVPQLKTESLAGFPEASKQTIFPFTDLLLHDMGPDLADNRTEFDATGQEWRTAPLWGLGLVQLTSGHTFLLHDGRARNVTEAILWHGGEAAPSRDFFKNEMSRDERAKLVAFVNSL